jgi:hypothetical protein
MMRLRNSFTSPNGETIRIKSPSLVSRILASEEETERKRDLRLMISEIHLENVLSFENSSIPFKSTANSHIFIGHNGSGKTNVFRCVELALSHFGQKRPNIDLNEYFRDKSKPILIKFDLNPSDTLKYAIREFCKYEIIASCIAEFLESLWDDGKINLYDHFVEDHDDPNFMTTEEAKNIGLARSRSRITKWLQGSVTGRRFSITSFFDRYESKYTPEWEDFIRILAGKCIDAFPNAWRPAVSLSLRGTLEDNGLKEFLDLGANFKLKLSFDRNSQHFAKFLEHNHMKDFALCSEVIIVENTPFSFNDQARLIGKYFVASTLLVPFDQGIRSLSDILLTLGKLEESERLELIHRFSDSRKSGLDFFEESFRSYHVTLPHILLKFQQAPVPATITAVDRILAKGRNPAIARLKTEFDRLKEAMAIFGFEIMLENGEVKYQGRSLDFSPGALQEGLPILFALLQEDKCNIFLDEPLRSWEPYNHVLFRRSFLNQVINKRDKFMKVFISTHSSSLLGFEDFSHEGIYWFRKLGDSATRVQLLKGVTNFCQTLPGMRMLFERCVIFVEGRSDELVFGYLKSVNSYGGPDEELLMKILRQACILQCDSKSNFPDAIEAAKKLSIPYVFIGDADAVDGISRREFDRKSVNTIKDAARKVEEATDPIAELRLNGELQKLKTAARNTQSKRREGEREELFRNFCRDIVLQAETKINDFSTLSKAFPSLFNGPCDCIWQSNRRCLFSKDSGVCERIGDALRSGDDLNRFSEYTAKNYEIMFERLRKAALEIGSFCWPSKGGGDLETVFGIKKGDYGAGTDWSKEITGFKWKDHVALQSLLLDRLSGWKDQDSADNMVAYGKPKKEKGAGNGKEEKTTANNDNNAVADRDKNKKNKKKKKK